MVCSVVCTTRREGRRCRLRRWEKDVKRRMLTMPEEDAHYERRRDGWVILLSCRAPLSESCPVSRMGGCVLVGWLAWLGDGIGAAGGGSDSEHHAGVIERQSLTNNVTFPSRKHDPGAGPAAWSVLVRWRAVYDVCAPANGQTSQTQTRGYPPPGLSRTWPPSKPSRPMGDPH